MAKLKQVYDPAFYAGQIPGSLRSAKAILPRVLSVLSGYPIHSICDFGCGVGTWLSVAASLGIAKIAGFDGGYVPQQQLMIAPASFFPVDLATPQIFDRRFDLALSLEVAEHIPEIHADIFLDNLVSLAPVILFSACPPTPRHGTGHVNEKTQSYWANKLWSRGYSPTTIIRDIIWVDQDIEWFYRQNIVLYVKHDLCGSISANFLDRSYFHLLDIRHPDFVEIVISESINMHSPASLIVNAVRKVFC